MKQRKTEFAEDEKKRDRVNKSSEDMKLRGKKDT